MTGRWPFRLVGTAFTEIPFPSWPLIWSISADLRLNRGNGRPAVTSSLPLCPVSPWISSYTAALLTRSLRDTGWAMNLPAPLKTILLSTLRPPGSTSLPGWVRENISKRTRTRFWISLPVWWPDGSRRGSVLCFLPKSVSALSAPGRWKRGCGGWVSRSRWLSTAGRPTC